MFNVRLLVVLATLAAACATTETPRTVPIDPPTRTMVGLEAPRFWNSPTTPALPVFGPGCLAVAGLGAKMTKAVFWDVHDGSRWVPLPADAQVMVELLYLDSNGQVQVKSGQNTVLADAYTDNRLHPFGTCAALEAALCAPLSNYALMVDCP